MPPETADLPADSADGVQRPAAVMADPVATAPTPEQAEERAQIRDLDDDGQVHLGKTDARQAATTGHVRYILGLSLGFGILALALVFWFWRTPV